MATDLGLAPGWLSGAAQAFIPLPDDDPISLDVEGLGARIKGSLNLDAVAANRKRQA